MTIFDIPEHLEVREMICVCKECGESQALRWSVERGVRYVNEIHQPVCPHFDKTEVATAIVLLETNGYRVERLQ